MKVLVTGGAGFIGFHVSKFLLERGNEVVCVDNFNDSYNPQLKEDRVKVLQTFPFFTLHRADISNNQELKKVFEEHSFNKICHLAARAGVLPSIEDPFPYEQANILGTLVIFHLAKEHNVKDVVYASSSSVYGGNKEFPASETHTVDNPLSLYAASKKSDELMAHCYKHLFGMNMTGLRFFNVYGEWGRPDMMAWIFTKNIIEGKPINVNNNGDTWKDYTYYKDIVKGVIAALDTPLSYEVINLGNHTPVHLKKCIEIIEQETGKKAIMEMKPMQPGDVVKSCADVSKAKKLLNWEPTTNMEEGLVNFIRWYKEYKGITQ